MEDISTKAIRAKNAKATHYELFYMGEHLLHYFLKDIVCYETVSFFAVSA